MFATSRAIQKADGAKFQWAKEPLKKDVTYIINACLYLCK